MTFVGAMVTFIPFGEWIISFIGNLAITVVSVPLGFGFLCQIIAVANGKQIEYGNLFKFAIDNFSKVWKVQLRVLLKLLGPIILIIVGLGGIMFSITLTTMSIFGDDILKILGLILALFFFVVEIAGAIWTIPISYKYKFCLNELIYNSNATAKEIVERSGNLMVGKRLGEFWLELTFIGWSILGVLGLYIPFLWISPYIMISTALYYEWASGRLQSPVRNPMQNPMQGPTNNYYQG